MLVVPVPSKFYKYYTVYKKVKFIYSQHFLTKMETFSNSLVSHFLKLHFLKCGIPLLFKGIKKLHVEETTV